MGIRDELQKRKEHRDASAVWQAPVKVFIHLPDESIQADVVNYHYRGTCLRIESKDLRVLKPQLSLDFFLGNQCIRKEIPFRIAWENIREDGIFGIEFLEPMEDVVLRATRFPTNVKMLPQITTKDPINPSRDIFFSILDMSETGMRVKTSLSNRHLFPGMVLRNSYLQIPGEATETLDLMIVRAAKCDDSNDFEVGLNVSVGKEIYLEKFKNYVSKYATLNHTSERLEALQNAGVYNKNLLAAYSYRFVTTQAEYEKVLKLRYEGYGAHGKVAAGKNWKDMGEGLSKEGMILASYLGGEMIASIEIRLGKKHGFRMLPENSLGLDIDRDNTIEINKLVVHPRIQRSDAVVGMFQRMHGFALQMGKPDVLLACTDKLLPTYLLLGATDLKHRIPHPTLSGQGLNLTLIRSKNYLYGLGVNPYSWVKIYEETLNFFSSINALPKETVSRTRIVSDRVLQSMLHPKAWLGAYLSKKNRTVKGQSKTTTSYLIDPRWTEQHMMASVLLPYILEAEDMIGSEHVQNILKSMNIPRDYFFKKGNWLSVAFMDEFLNSFSKWGEISKLSTRAGYRSMKKDVLGVNYYLLKSFGSPKLIISEFSKVVSKFNRTRTYKILNMHDGFARLRVGLKDPKFKPQHRESCLNWIASFEAGAGFSVNQKAKVKKTHCIYDGHDSCIYEVSWASLRTKKTPLLYAGFTTLVALSCYYVMTNIIQSAPEKALATSGVIFFAGLGLVALVSRAKSLKDYEDLAQDYQQFRKEMDDHYQDLQRAKSLTDHEIKQSLLLEITAKEILASEELETILNKSLDSICKTFGFSRAFAMLVDDKKEKLQTVAVAGLNDALDLIWKFEVDVTKKRDEPFVISTVYLSGNPVLINKIEDYLPRLKPSSQLLIKKLASSGFCMVAIPSIHGRWGVLLADKGSESHLMTERDLLLLERVAQQIGIALDKKSVLDHERSLKNLFQKYVPDSVLQLASTKVPGMLDGQQKDLLCLFVDIRRFSQFTLSYSPAIVVNTLNRFFTVLDDVCKKTSGTILKFMGDGALISWGIQGNLSEAPDKMMEAALRIFQEVDLLNIALKNEGITEIQIGIGAHVGPVIVGNIGSEGRVEATVIGESVNLASRLESATKDLNFDMVVSSKLYESLSDKNKALFELIEKVTIRGWKDSMTVAGMKKNMHEASNVIPWKVAA